MSSDLVLFLAFALAYTAAWWLVMRGTSPVVHVHVEEEERERPLRRARPNSAANTARNRAVSAESTELPRSIPLAKSVPAPIKTTAGAVPSAWSLPEPTLEAVPEPRLTPVLSSAAPPSPQQAAAPAASPRVAASRNLATDDPLEESVETESTAATAAHSSVDSPDPAPPAITNTPASAAGRETSAPNEPMTSPNDAMNSNPLDFPNWMEETMNSRSKSEPTPEPRSSEATASKPVNDASSTSSSRSTPTAGTAGDALRGLSRIEKERMQVMTQLDNWARAWAEVEKRSAQCVDDLSRQVESLAQEHAQCDGRRREMEQRSKEAATQNAAEIQSLRARVNECEPFVSQAKAFGARCTELEATLGEARHALEEREHAYEALEERFSTTSHEMDKLKDHLARSQDATKEATARELDWQRRYHEDTGKLMQQLTTKSQECERWIGENQKQKAEIDRQTRDLRAKDEIVQTISLRCSDLEQRSTTLQGSLQEKEARIVELARQVAELQKELENHKAAEEEQASMLQAAQGVLSELQPKLLQLEKRLTKH